MIEVTLPLTGHTGQTLTNLTFMMASKATLINKSIRCMDAFRITLAMYQGMKREVISEKTGKNQ